MKFTKIPATAFKNIQMNAGVLLDSFNPETGVVGNIIGATTGGNSFNATPSFKDYGEDIDNCPKNMLELKKLEAWEAKMSGTFVSVTIDTAKYLVGAGDTTTAYIKTTDTAVVEDKTYYTKSGDVYEEVEEPTTSDIANYYEVNFDKIVPRQDITTADFKDIWWVGDYSDDNNETNGGYCAIHLINSLSTGGFQIKSTDKGKGQFAFEFTGHYSMDKQTTPPFEIYIKG